MDPHTALSAAVIGVVEGLTEFLPISSTAHIVIAERLLGFRDDGEVFAVVIQLGAILAVCAYYWRRLLAMAGGLHRPGPERRFALSLLAAFIPIAVLGKLLNGWLEEHVFATIALAVIAVTTALGGVAILAIERWKPAPRHADATALPWRTALAIGLLNALAMVPGVSRSGASIMGSLCLGVERRAATEFSFFLAIPVMLAASVYKLWQHRHDQHTVETGTIAIGFAVSFVVALAVVHWLLRFVASHDFRIFGWYRIVLGLVLAGLLAAGVLTPGGLR
jgi:undecaprenyl-diphosphatase